jgi:hypothetical protein
MDFVYLVEHTYESDGIDEVKTIGIFSTRKKAQEAVEYLRYKPGFRDYPKKAFLISRAKIDRIGWSEGFCSFEESMAVISY